MITTLKTTTEKKKWVDFLAILTLCTLVFTQPILMALGDAATFFVAHNISGVKILIATFALVFLPAILLSLPIFAFRFISERAKSIYLLAVIFILATMLALITLNKTPITSPWLVIVMSIIFGAFFTLLFRVSSDLKTILSFASIAVVVVPVFFLFFTPVSVLILNSGTTDYETSNVESDTPVVFIVFDEFTPSSLLDSKGKIDDVRFPNFAEFAQTGTYYTNAMAVNYRTRIAIPSILTGQLPEDDVKEIPSQALYPNNLFTLLGSSYDLNVVERVSTLCPEEYCSSEEEGRKFIWSEFLADIDVVYRHIVYPRKWASAFLPDLDAGWKNFKDRATEGKRVETTKESTGDLELDEETKLKKIMADRRGKSRKIIFEDFIKNIDENNKSLDFLHIVIPHFAWNYLPDGRTYENKRTNAEDWWDSEVLTDEVYHRYLMQVGYVDTMVGELVSHLKSIDKYDNALVIIAADHGIHFLGGSTSRDITAVPAVLHVPLFIKYPYQDIGKIDNSYVYNTDIVPTIADVLDVKLPWKADGQSILSENRRKDFSLRVRAQTKEFLTFKPEDIVGKEVVHNRIAKFGERQPLEKLSIKGQFSELIGKKISELESLRIASNLNPGFKIDAPSFSNINSNDDYLPAMIYGDVSISEKSDENFSILFGLNGKVSSVVPMTGTGNIRTFSVLLPPADFKNGKNFVEAFLIRSDNNQPQLIEVDLNLGSYNVDKNKNPYSVTDSNGKKYPVITKSRPGHFETTIQENLIIFNGWAADIDIGKPADQVLMFKDSQFIKSTSTGRPSPGLGTATKKPNLNNSRFRVEITEEQLDKIPGEIRLYGIYTDEGYAMALEDQR